MFDMLYLLFLIENNKIHPGATYERGRSILLSLGCLHVAHTYFCNMYTICKHHIELKLCGHGTYGHFTHEPRIVITYL